MSDQAPAEKDDQPQKKKKGCSGCLFRLGLFGVFVLFLLGGSLAWLNGPGFRWLAQKYGPDLLSKSGFEGDFQLSGSLLAGPTIDSINLTSETSSLKSLSATNLRLRYNPLDLKELKIEGLTADSLSIDLDLSQSSPSPEKEDTPSKATLSEILAKYRPIATHPQIEITELDLHVHKGEQNFYQLQKASLSHTAQSASFTFAPGTVTDFEDKTFQPPLAEIIWNEDHFTLAQIPLSKEISLPDLRFEADPLLVAGQLTAFASTIELNTDLKSQVTATLGPDPLDLTPFLKLAPATQDATSQLTELTATASKLDQEFSLWTIDLALTLDGNRLQDRLIPQTKLTLAKEGLNLDTSLTFQLPKQSQQIDLLTVFAPESAQSPTTAWKNSRSDLTTELPSLATFLEGIAPILKLPVLPDGWPDGEALLLASIGIKDGQAAASQASLSFNRLDWAEAAFEKGELLIDFVDLNSDIKVDLLIEKNKKSTLSSRASFHPDTQAYAATFSAKNFPADSLQPFIRVSLGDFPLAGEITLDWEGSGELPDINSHRGKLSLAQTRVSIQKQTPIQLNLAANYQGINRVELTQLQIQQDDQRLSTQAIWDGKRIQIPQLSLIKSEQQLLTGQLSVPFSLDLDLKNYFTLSELWNIDLNADRLNIPETCELLGLTIPPGLDGTVTLDLAVAGSPATPSLAGKLLLEKFSLQSISQLPPTTARLAWATAGQTLTLDGTLEPDGRNPIVITGNTGFHPQKWTENPDSFLDEPFNLQALAPNIDLAPFAELSPAVKSLEGSLIVQLKADGTFRKPNLTGNIDLDLPKARFNINRLRRVRQTTLKLNFVDNQIKIAPFSTSIDGGLLDLTGTVDITDIKNPALDLRLNVDKALLWRDDNINARADAALFLKGTLQQSRLSGEIGIVESLFYKDIELLPLNVPVSTPKALALPSAGKKTKKGKNKNSLPIPEPFASWTLDLQARTVDPFLVRGNLTKGEVVGGLTATGQLGSPQLNGELLIEELSAALPFSSLAIKSGKATFSPKGGFIPTLNIRAQSRIPPYEVDLFVAGPANSPEVSFASSPPLPENEVITLLATGSTAAGLEDADSAKGKAFQLLIEKVRRAPPGSRLHPFAKIVSPLKDVELQVGGSDPFTGKRRNSVTIPVPESNRWFVTAAVDSESNTRGLVLYILKFR